jgi:hypothetical protein
MKMGKSVTSVMIRVMAIDTTNQKVRYIVAEGESITGEVIYQVKSGQIVEYVNGYKLALEKVWRKHTEKAR